MQEYQVTYRWGMSHTATMLVNAVNAQAARAIVEAKGYNVLAVRS